MVYCMTETNLWPSRPEDGECPTNKGSTAELPRGGASHLRRTSVAPIGLGTRDTPRSPLSHSRPSTSRAIGTSSRAIGTSSRAIGTSSRAARRSRRPLAYRDDLNDIAVVCSTRLSYPPRKLLLRHVLRAVQAFLSLLVQSVGDVRLSGFDVGGRRRRPCSPPR
jgi:hypothetical protein